MSATILQFVRPQYEYVIEATYTLDNRMELVRHTINAPNIATAWRKADLIADGKIWDTWLVWRKDSPESMPKH